MPENWSVIPSIRVTDMARALEFYTTTLGFELTRGSAAEDNVAVSRGDARLMIERPAGFYSESYNNAIRNRLGGFSPIALYIEAHDLDELYGRVSEAGVTIPDPLADREWGQREFTVEDPDGTWLTFWAASGSQ